MLCPHIREIAGVPHSCELRGGHPGDHMFAFTAGQLKALEYSLAHPKIASFPGEAVLLFFAAIGVEVFTTHRSALDWGASFVMIATAIRWLRQWQDGRKSQ